MKNVKVSVIIPVYQVEKFIEQCARSLYEQTYDSIEYIWVNDATPDMSIEILKEVTEKYPKRKSNVRIITHEHNMGLPRSRRTGVSHAEGEYIYHCDSDDWAEKDMIEMLLRSAEANQSDIVWCDFYRSYSDRDLLDNQGHPAQSRECIRRLLSEQMHGGYWNKLFKRELYLNSITYSAEASMCEDLRGVIQLFYYAKRIFYLPKAFYHYRQDNNQSLSITFSADKINNLLINVDAIIDFLNEKGATDDFSPEINYLKHLGKRNLLTSTDLRDFKRWNLIYPESSSQIMSYKALPVSLRLIGLCTYLRLWALVSAWIKLKKIKNYVNR